MKRDKLKIYFFEILLIIILFFALFASNIFTRNILAVIILLYAIMLNFSLKNRKIHSIYKKQVDILMLIFSGIYLIVFYLLGLYFDFTQSKVLLSWWSFFRFIVPLSIIIISSEMIRRTFISHKLTLKFKGKEINPSIILIYISMVLIDLLIYTEVYDLTNLDDFLTALGFVLFASLSCNLFYNYISSRFGSKGIIFYRLVTTLFVYVIPVTPDVYIFFRSFLRMVYPYLIYIFLDKFYSKTDFVISQNDKRSSVFWTMILLVIMTLMIMLISCKFKYGILVIGSHSMTGTLNIGDAVIFERYEIQPIKEGQVIVFDYNGLETIHRIIEIKNVNGEKRYYTKGDANEKMDAHYITNDDIHGLVRLRVKYIGKPTLWIRELFS